MPPHTCVDYLCILYMQCAILLPLVLLFLFLSLCSTQSNICSVSFPERWEGDEWCYGQSSQEKQKGRVFFLKEDLVSCDRVGFSAWNNCSLPPLPAELVFCILFSSSWFTARSCLNVQDSASDKMLEVFLFITLRVVWLVVASFWQTDLKAAVAPCNC